jgi:hypothetical protein
MEKVDEEMPPVLRPHFEDLLPEEGWNDSGVWGRAVRVRSKGERNPRHPGRSGEAIHEWN